MCGKDSMWLFFLDKFLIHSLFLLSACLYCDLAFYKFSLYPSLTDTKGS